MIIEGSAETPRYIVIDDDKVGIKPADTLLGKTTSEKDRIIIDELGDETFQNVLIGPAGENLVREANGRATLAPIEVEETPEEAAAEEEEGER